jgi:Fur family transcriptional regulator, ferric uptake regulator
MINSKLTSNSISSLEDAINRCKSLGMRVSRQRRFILDLLWETSEHLSAREIYDRLNQRGKSIGHTSVYQNLEALASKGLLECIDRYNGRLYGSSTDSHSHFHCTDTLRIIDVRVQLPAETIASVELQTGMEIVDYRIEFFGHPDKSESK